MTHDNQYVSSHVPDFPSYQGFERLEVFAGRHCNYSGLLFSVPTFVDRFCFFVVVLF